MQATTMNIQSEKRMGNLFIKVSGSMSRMNSDEIRDSIMTHYDGSGNVFFNVEKIALQEENDVCRRLLTDVLTECRLSPDKFFLIGKQGLNMGPDGCRVIVPRKKTCCGKCRNCHC